MLVCVLALTGPAAPLFGPGETPMQLAIEAKAADLGPVLSYALIWPSKMWTWLFSAVPRG